MGAVFEAAMVGEIGGVLGRDHELVADVWAGGQPFSDPCLGLLGLVVVGRVNEIAALGVKEIEHFKGTFFVHFTHETFPAEEVSREMQLGGDWFGRNPSRSI